MIRRFLLACTPIVVGLLLSATPALASVGLKSSGPVEFGAVDIHSSAAPTTLVEIEDISGSPMLLSAVTIEGPQSFSVIQDNCSNQMLGPFMSCSIEVEFQAQTRGTTSAMLDITGSEGQLEVPLSGEGVTGTLSATPSPVHFSPLPYAQLEHEGEGNETEQVNALDSLAGIQVAAVSIVGADASSFSISYGDCEGRLMASGNTCDEGVRFEPHSAGIKHAVLLIESDASSGTLEVPLEGVALEGPKLTISSRQALLGEVPVGGSAQNVFTLTNTGDYPLYMERAFLVSGTPLMFPTLEDSCSGHVLQPGTSCSMTIGFSPSVAGERSAGVILITNATPSIQVIGIDGTGVLPATAIVTPLPSAMQPDGTSAPLAVLASVRLPHLESGATVHSGLLVHCPAGSGSCQILTRITTASHARSPQSSGEGGMMLLGSSSTQLAAGATGHAHIHLTSHATMLLNRRLRRQGRLTVTITTEVRAGATTLATRSRSLVLGAQGASAALTHH